MFSADIFLTLLLIWTNPSAKRKLISLQCEITYHLNLEWWILISKKFSRQCYCFFGLEFLVVKKGIVIKCVFVTILNHIKALNVKVCNYHKPYIPLCGDVMNKT